MKHRHIVPALMCVLAVFGWILLVNGDNHSAAVDTTTATNTSGSTYCAQVSLTKPYSGQVLTGIVSLEVSTTTTFQAGKVEFLVDSQLVGNGVPNGQYWTFGLDSRLWPNGTHKIQARVYDTSGYRCDTSTIDISVNNTSTTTATTSKLVLKSSLSDWSGPTNVNIDLGVSAQLVYSSGQSQDVTSQASYDWSTSLGLIKPYGSKATFNSGPTAGTGNISVVVSYGTLKQALTVPIKVSAYESGSSTYPSGTSSDGSVDILSDDSSTPKTISEASGSTLTTATTRYGQGDSELEKCLIQILGKDTYTNIIEKKTGLTYDQIQKANQCFARRSNVVPANLAPVAPEKVKSLTVDETSVKVAKLETVTTNGKKTIQLSGTATPDKTVVIFVFSEPLVLTTKADKTGRWTYSLEDPMVSGNHEAYVTVEGDNEKPVRSNGFAFAVATAPKTKENPLGLSFSVSEATKPNNYFKLYIAAAVLVVLVAAAVAFWVLRKRRTHIAPLADTSANEQVVEKPAEAEEADTPAAAPDATTSPAPTPSDPIEQPSIPAEKPAETTPEHNDAPNQDAQK